MKINKVIYWIATGIVSLMMTMSGVMYFTNPEVVEGFVHMGFPSYFRIELGVAKLLGAVVLIFPQIPAKIKEWAYAGFGITFISAVIAHINSGDTGSTIAGPAIFLLILIVSRVYFDKAADAKVALTH